MKVQSTIPQSEIEMHIPEVRLRWDFTTEEVPIDIDSNETTTMHFYREVIFSTRNTEEEKRSIISNELSKYLSGSQLDAKLNELHNKWTTYKTNYNNNL